MIPPFQEYFLLELRVAQEIDSINSPPRKHKPHANGFQCHNPFQYQKYREVRTNKDRIDEHLWKFQKIVQEKKSQFLTIEFFEFELLQQQK